MKARGKTSFRIAESGAGEHFLRPDGRGKACAKGMFFSQISVGSMMKSGAWYFAPRFQHAFIRFLSVPQRGIRKGESYRAIALESLESDHFSGSPISDPLSGDGDFDMHLFIYIYIYYDYYYHHHYHYYYYNIYTYIYKVEHLVYWCV